jgi:hypothetical protein|uniref:Uncharacterized protein n=1 Tax=Sipha flava TaxID=143950 RepID=A0A2S2QG84_9HEMI
MKILTRRGKNKKLTRKLKRNIFKTCNYCDTDKRTTVHFASGFDFFDMTVSRGMITHVCSAQNRSVIRNVFKCLEIGFEIFVHNWLAAMSVLRTMIVVEPPTENTVIIIHTVCNRNV